MESIKTLLPKFKINTYESILLNKLLNKLMEEERQISETEES